MPAGWWIEPWFLGAFFLHFSKLFLCYMLGRLYDSIHHPKTKRVSAAVYSSWVGVYVSAFKEKFSSYSQKYCQMTWRT